MFNRKTQEKVCSLVQRVITLEAQTKQLKCKHEKTEFRGVFCYREVCLSCGVNVQVFDFETDYRKAIIKGLEKELKAETAKLKEIEGT